MSRPAHPPGSESDRFRRLERKWQDEVGHALLDLPFANPGSALVFAAQFERVEGALAGIAEGPLVEVGCGRGQLLEHLRKTAIGRERLLLGVDVSVAVAVLPERGAVGVCADGEFLPFRDGTVAAVVYNGALHHIVDYRAAIREALRVLRPGGRLVIFEPVSSAFSQVVHRVLDPIIFRTSCEYESPVDQEYKHTFREEAVIAELEACGAHVRREKSDFLAYPFTGCYAGSLFTKSTRFMRGLLALERGIDRLPGVGSLARLFAWRFLLVATKSGDHETPSAVARGLGELVACPKCKKQIGLVQSKDAFACNGCRLRYRNDGDIPILLLDEATPL